MKAFSRAFFSWLPLAVAIVGLCGLVSVTVQQNYRQSLNDPQIQMAEDGATKLSSGGVPADIVPKGVTIDIAQSLSPWIAVYDSTGKPLETEAVLNGAPPQLPAGVFDTTQWSGPIVGHHLVANPNENRISWQPSPGVRQAVVIVPAGKYFVVAGRSMREVERREGDLNTMVGLAIIVLLVGTFVAKVFAYWAKARIRL